MGICDGCHAGCCRTFVVPLTGADILRIERSVGVSFWDFVCRWADPEGTIAKRTAPHFFFSDEPATPFVIGLLHVPSQIFTGTSKCRFLVEQQPDEQHELGVGRCAIYAQRPLVCQVFPTTFDKHGHLASIQKVPEYGSPDKHPVHRLCPRQWQPADLDPVDTPSALASLFYELRFFHTVATVWNRNPQSWLDFPDFLRLVYSQRISPLKTTEEASEVEQSVENEDSIVSLPLASSKDKPQTKAA